PELGELERDAAPPEQSDLDLDRDLDREPLDAAREVRHALAARVTEDELAHLGLVGRQLERDEARADLGDARVVAKRARRVEELEIDGDALAGARAGERAAEQITIPVERGEERRAVCPRDAVLVHDSPRSMT